MKRFLVFLIIICCCLGVKAETDMTARKTETMRLLNLANDYFMNKVSDPTLNSITDKVRPSHIWTRGVYYEGLMALYDIDPQQRYLDYTDEWAVYHNWAPRASVWKVHADDQCCTQTYMMRYFKEGGKEKYEKAMADFDNQIAGTDRSTHIQDWTWIDALQMAMPAFAMMTRITGNRKYIDYAMESYRWTRNTCGNGLYVASTGLWWRDAKLVNSAEGYWSRGNGWVIAALVRVMEQLEESDEYYAELKADYLAMCKALPLYQNEDGSWSASMDKPAYSGKELTGTSLFLYGLAWGINKGYLAEEEYKPVIEKAWQACVSCIHEDGFLGYVQGTADRPSKGYPFTYDAVPNFEDYGLGCLLLGGTEYYKMSFLRDTDKDIILKGDMDGDGRITMTDANILMNIYLNQKK